MAASPVRLLLLLCLTACTSVTEVGSFDPAAGPPGSSPSANDGGPGGPPPSAEGGADGPAPPGSPIPPGSSLLRIITASWDVQALDVCLVNAERTVGPLFGSIGDSSGTGFLANMGYFTVPSGDYDLHAVGTGLPCSQAPLFPATPVKIVAGERATALVHGSLALSQGKRAPKVSMLRDDITPPPSTQSKIRFVHAAAELDGPLDLEWRLPSGSQTYTVALTDAPYGGVAKGSPLGALSADGYLQTTLSTSFSRAYRFRSEGVTLLRPNNTFRAVLNDVLMPMNTKGTSFTVIVVGTRQLSGSSVPETIVTPAAFAICVDDDRRAATNQENSCTIGLEPR